MESDEERARRLRARSLAAEAVAAGDETGWFERLDRLDQATAEAAGWSPFPPAPEGGVREAREDRPFPGLSRPRCGSG